jgi:uncharacterized repeat protein (TIGR03806 family)
MAKQIMLITFFILITLLIFSECKNEPNLRITDANVPEDTSEYPYKQKLSDYDMFLFPLTEMKPKEGVFPYDLNSSLFTDYAFKKRFIYLPPGASMDYHPTDAFGFPDGSLIFKFFYYPSNFAEPEKNFTIIETRVLLKENKKWSALTYIWNDEQTDAVLSLAGDYKYVNWTDEAGRKQSVKYSIPGILQCKSCHEFNSQIEPIGPSARHMNKTYSFDQTSVNQLNYLKNNQKIKNLPAPDSIPSIADWSNLSSGLEERSRAYLDINCAHCHRKEGPAKNSGLYLTSDEQNPSVIGVNKSPVAAGRGSGGLKYDIVPGDPDASILIYRMKSSEPGVMMPELGRRTVHDEGIELVSEWIRSMQNI